MRIRKDGERYLQDRRPQDAPKAAQTLPPSALARHSINQATISTEIAARCLAERNMAAWQDLRIALSYLKRAMEALGV